ncbi:unnamed protein product [Paramecium octaurelia]|uniref:Uncharacterized protein n=1 Tax=Paramecium octaurelia TaxID=43137 RepID=A0A8S1UB44_PAROT|nr:unnamed protein product [Paramecium octaurelia]
MIKQQNIQQLFPNLQEQSYQTLQRVYENIALQQFHVLVQQIKTKFPIPEQINAVQFPTQENVVEFFQNYNPIILDLTHIQDVKIKLYKNAAFYGTLIDGLRQGQGILIKSTLQLYEGSFLRDKKDGIGFELLKQNQFYYGTYLNGVPHGEGVFWSKNQKYIGQWHQGKKHGIGWYKGSHSDYYLGQWENGRCFGHCIYINGDIYVGYVTNDLKHGKGQEYFENGDYFVGEYRNGKPNGYGEFYWNNGNFYKGEFVNGQRNGQGMWESKTQEGVNIYKGQYANDKKCGQGVFQYANGTIFQGYFVDDKRCGYGEIIWQDKATYKGYWVDGLMEGEGVYEYDTLVLKGNWKSNQLQTIDKVRVSLNQFPQQHNLKEINEDDEIRSQMPDEPDQDEIGNQFQSEILTSKTDTIPGPIQTASHQTSHNEAQFHQRLPILQRQFEILSPTDQGLHYQTLDASHRQNSSSIGIQTESNKKFLPKLVLNKKTPTQYSSSVDHQQNGNNKFKFDSLSNSPNTRGTDQSNKSNREQKKPNRSIQYRGRKNKQALLSKKEQNIWAIKMNKLKLSPAKYTKLWNHEIVSEIKQFLYPPIWKPPSHLS